MSTGHSSEAPKTASQACPGCGQPVQAGGRGMGRVFCSTPCRQGFNNRMKIEGGPIAALVKAWVMTRHAKPGTEEAEVCKYARSQLTLIATMRNDSDRWAKRPSAVEYVKTLMASGYHYADRTNNGAVTTFRSHPK